MMNDEVESGSLYNKMMSKICIVPRVEGSGGMASFRLKFEEGLKSRGIEITYDLSAKSDAMLVIAGTRNLWQLYQARRRGIRIVQRLDVARFRQIVLHADGALGADLLIDRGRRLLGFIQLGSGDDDVRAVLGIPIGNGVANAARRAGHNRRLAREIEQFHLNFLHPLY